jgi:hypothetical protein
MAVPLVLATFIGMNFWAEKLVAYSGLEVSPWCTGGEVMSTVEHDQYKTLIHRPVFDGLIGQRRNGFVQIKWTPNENLLPKIIDEEIDFDSDGTNDFRLRLNPETNEAQLEAFSERVVSVDEVLVLGSERLVRVLLRKTPD